MATVASSKRSRALLELALRLRDCCAAEEEAVRKKLELNPAEYTCLVHMPASDSIHAGELAERMALSASRGSRVIDALVRRGLLVRTQDEDDRRVSLISLTKPGARAKADIDRLLESCERRLMDGLDAKEIERAYEGMRIMVRALSKEEED